MKRTVQAAEECVSSSRFLVAGVVQKRDMTVWAHPIGWKIHYPMDWCKARGCFEQTSIKNEQKKDAPFVHISGQSSWHFQHRVWKQESKHSTAYGNLRCLAHKSILWVRDKDRDRKQSDQPSGFSWDWGFPWELGFAFSAKNNKSHTSQDVSIILLSHLQGSKHRYTRRKM